ncbi:MAG: tetratricopeptide repeat protein [Planctomycetota bacterium]|jgi:tetratricopeptide (TPR) repeat protein
MGEKSIFGLDPDQLDELLSIGTDDVNEVDPKNKKSPPVGNVASVQESDAPNPTASLDIFAEQPGGKIDRYKLLDVLGEGGMGIVYLAEQEEPIRRQVALKVVKPGMDSARVIARFEAERQALALLDHPNIAHVYDAGTTENGRPYFAMEYVEGLPITEHCDRHKLTIEERLKLLLQVCYAVHHAHQKGIIHRDIKPSNILVSFQEDQAVPKIIDFGVAKAINQPLTERTLFTEQGQLFGTPEYMSPEQADMATEDIDTRSDIYSLGVLLYVLLTGVLPFDSSTFREGGIEHIRQVIREADPKTPSTRLSSLGEEAKKVAQSRRTEVATLAKRLHKELEWIPLKAMRKERAERYRSISELADDIENYLRGNPLIAGPLTAAYRLKKFVRRNRALVTGVAAILVVLIVGIVASTVFAIKAEHARAEAQAVSDFLRNSVLEPLNPYSVGGRVIATRSVLDAASEGLEEKLKGMPLAEAEIQDTLGEAYQGLGLYKRAEFHHKRALDIYRAERGPEHPATLESMYQLGWVYYLQSRYRQAEQLLFQARQTGRRLWGEGHEDTLYSTMGLANVYNKQGRFQEAERLIKKALKTTRDVLGEEHRHVPAFMNQLSRNYNLQGRYNEAERQVKQGLKIASRVYGENHWSTLYVKRTAGRTCLLLGRYDEAEKLLQEDQKGWGQTWGEEHPHTLKVMVDLGWLYHRQGRYEEAEAQFSRVLKAAQRVLGDTHWTTADCMHGLGALCVSQGRYDEAEPLLEEALEIANDLLGEKNWYALRVMNTLAKLYMTQGRSGKAESLFKETLAERLSKLGEDHPETLESKNDLGVLYKEHARYDDAEQLLLEAVEGRIQKLGQQHPDTIASLNNIIDLYEAWGKPEKAQEWRANLPHGKRREGQ